MDTSVIGLTALLRDELVRSSRPPIIDPATVPARFSTLKLFAQSPLHYWYACQREFEETLSQRLGSGAHAILFSQPYVVWAGKVRNGKVWDKFEADHAGQLILSQREIEQAQAMADAIRGNELACSLLFAPGVELEKRIDWTWQGRSFRSTPDAASRTDCTDLKCLRSAEPDKVKWQSFRMHYHAQAACYRRALNSDGWHQIKTNHLVVVENKPPYPVTVFRFKESAIEAGDQACSTWMEQLHACEASGVYPGYSQSILDLGLPGSELDDFTFEEEDNSNED